MSVIFKNLAMAGRAAIVTGAASGLGRMTALKLAEAGADLWLVDINEAGLAETIALLAPSGRAAGSEVADLSSPEACHAVVAHALQKFGRLDALCNVAGLIYLANTPQMPQVQYERTIDVNLNAPFFLSQAAIPHLLASDAEGGGAIVNVTSCASYIGEAYAAAYCASKWGLLGMTKAMAMEFQKQPIRINAVAPGGMITNIISNFAPPENCDFELLKRFSGMRGQVEVEDVADTIVLLASPAGRGFHGACITLDAGITAG